MPSKRSASLVALTVHYSLLTIVLHSSRARHDANTENYKATSAVALSELGKLMISLALALKEVLESGDVPFSSASEQQGLGIALDHEVQTSTPARSPAKSAHHKARRRRTSSQFAIAIDDYKTPEQQQGEFPGHGQSSSFDATPWFSPHDEFPSFTSPEKVPFSLHNSPEKAEGIPLDEFITRSAKMEQTPAKPAIIEERSWSWRQLLRVTARHVFNAEALRLAVPAVMFTCQATLQHVAIANLSVPAFQVTAQLKILTTAFCSVVLLNRKLSRVQWLSLTLLAIGVGVIQLQAQPSAAAPAPEQVAEPAPTATTPFISKDDDALDFQLPEMNQLLGICAVILMSLSSGFASTYFELCLKSAPKQAPAPGADVLPRHSPASQIVFDSKDMARDLSGTSVASNVPLLAPPAVIAPKADKPAGLWVRNVQLSCFALTMGILMFYLETNQDAFKAAFGMWWGTSEMLEGHTGFIGSLKPVSALAGDFFAGFGWVAWVVVVLQIIGGLLSALVIKHADNIAKNFSTSLSILLSFVASVFLFDFVITASFLIGALFVIAATWLFGPSATEALKRWFDPAYEPVSSEPPRSPRREYIRSPYVR